MATARLSKPESCQGHWCHWHDWPEEMSREANLALAVRDVWEATSRKGTEKMQGLAVRENTSGTSCAVYYDGAYLGAVFFVAKHSFGATYCPPACRLGCKSSTGCGSDAICKHPDKAYTSMCKDPWTALSWLMEKHSYKPGQGWEMFPAMGPSHFSNDFIDGKAAAVRQKVLSSYKTSTQPARDYAAESEHVIRPSAKSDTSRAPKPVQRQERKRQMDIGEHVDDAKKELGL